jgi:predicted transposase/invertase (TIGR01784 family)
MRTDKLVYLVLQLAPNSFFALIGRNPDDASRYSFQYVELKETAFRLDGVFVPTDDADFTYFVEAQFQTDKQFYARFFAEIFLYLKQYPVKRWKAAVIYPSKSVEQKSAENYRDLLELDRITRVYLDELPERGMRSVGLFKLLIEPEQTAGERARELALGANAVELDIIEQILTYKFRNLKRAEIRKMLKIQEELLKDTAFYREAFEEGREEGREKGKAEGEAQGVFKGERAAKLSTVPLLRRLGLTDEQISLELNLPLADVQNVKS